MNKKIVFFLLLFYSVIANAQTYYYRCDENFTIIELISVNTISQFDFFMKKSITANGEEQYYYKNQILQKKILIKNEQDRITEETWQADVLLNIKIYSKNKLVYEKYFSKNLGEYEIMEYVYKDELLVKIDIKQESGIVYVIDYFYDVKGIIRAISINDKIINLTAFTKSQILTTWNQDTFIIEYYNEMMSLLKKEVYALTGEMILNEVLTYKNDTLLSRTLTDFLSNTITRKIYTDGLLQEETKESINNKTIFYIKQYLYNDTGMCVKFIEIEGSNTRVIEYSYDEKAKKIQEKLYTNGKLSKIVSFISDSDYIIEYYETDGIILKVYFTDGKKTKEEAWQNDVLLFEKNYL